MKLITGIDDVGNAALRILGEALRLCKLKHSDDLPGKA
jgi:hypothetical protein